MTFREKLMQENPECVGEDFVGGCKNCPQDYGYEIDEICGRKGDIDKCRACWDREAPLTPEEQEEHDLEINEEIIRGYCNQYELEPCHLCPAFIVCGRGTGTWRANSQNPKCPTSAEKQRAMLDAFEAAMPPEEDVTYPVRRRIPESVRDLIDSRIISIDNQIKFLQSERQELIDFWNGKDMEK